MKDWGIKDMLPFIERECSISFDDFKADYNKLVGHRVLHEQGQSFAKINNYRLVSITKVTKTGFRITDSEDSFDFHGNVKGKHDMSYISRCVLITHEEASDISAFWKNRREKKKMVSHITNSIESCSIDKIRSIYEGVLKEIPNEEK